MMGLEVLVDIFEKDEDNRSMVGGCNPVVFGQSWVCSSDISIGTKSVDVIAAPCARGFEFGR
jgi:hypothetical protein